MFKLDKKYSRRVQIIIIFIHSFIAFYASILALHNSWIMIRYIGLCDVKVGSDLTR